MYGCIYKSAYTRMYVYVLVYKCTHVHESIFMGLCLYKSIRVLSVLCVFYGSMFIQEHTCFICVVCVFVCFMCVMCVLCVICVLCVVYNMVYVVFCMLCCVLCVECYVLYVTPVVYIVNVVCCMMYVVHMLIELCRVYVAYYV